MSGWQHWRWARTAAVRPVPPTESQTWSMFGISSMSFASVAKMWWPARAPMQPFAIRPGSELTGS